MSVAEPSHRPFARSVDATELYRNYPSFSCCLLYFSYFSSSFPPSFLPSFLQSPFVSNNYSYASIIIMHGNRKRQATPAISIGKSSSEEIVKRPKGKERRGARQQPTAPSLASRPEQPQCESQRILTRGSQIEEKNTGQRGDVILEGEIKEQRVSGAAPHRLFCHAEASFFDL